MNGNQARKYHSVIPGEQGFPVEFGLEHLKFKPNHAGMGDGEAQIACRVAQQQFCKIMAFNLVPTMLTYFFK